MQSSDHLRTGWLKLFDSRRLPRRRSPKAGSDVLNDRLNDQEKTMRTKFRNIAEAICILAFTSACATAQFAPARLDVHYDSRTSVDKIELFRSSKPSKAYLEIGAVVICCGGNTSSMVDKLREKASALGGDALIDLDVSADGRASATVVRYQGSKEGGN
jgi:hypothetical protein